MLIRNPVKTPTIEECLQKSANNYNLLRLILAIGVIYGHSFLYHKIDQGQDIIQFITHIDYAGSLAVKVFFFLSGLLVTNSLLETKKPLSFLISRFFRVYPALVACLLFCSFILGPIFTTDPLIDYFQNKHVYGFTLRNILMQTRTALPGLFLANKYPTEINGSLWTLSYEMFAYISLFCFYNLKLLQNRIFATIIIFMLIYDSLASTSLLFSWVEHNFFFNLIASSFCFGSLLAIWRDKIVLCPIKLLSLWIVTILFKSSAISFCLYYPSLFLTLTYIFSSNILNLIRIPWDISYGVYLYGMPIQMALLDIFPDNGLLFHNFLAIFIASILGILSWFLIEKPSIQFGKHIANNFDTIIVMNNLHRYIAVYKILWYRKLIKKPIMAMKYAHFL